MFNTIEHHIKPAAVMICANEGEMQDNASLGEIFRDADGDTYLIVNDERGNKAPALVGYSYIDLEYEPDYPLVRVPAGSKLTITQDQ